MNKNHAQLEGKQFNADLELRVKVPFEAMTRAAVKSLSPERGFDRGDK